MALALVATLLLVLDRLSLDGIDAGPGRGRAW